MAFFKLIQEISNICKLFHRQKPKTNLCRLTKFTFEIYRTKKNLQNTLKKDGQAPGNNSTNIQINGVIYLYIY